MIKVSQDYINSSEESTRKSYIVAKYGLYNKLAKSEANVQVSNSSQPVPINEEVGYVYINNNLSNSEINDLIDNALNSINKEAYPIVLGTKIDGETRYDYVLAIGYYLTEVSVAKVIMFIQDTYNNSTNDLLTENYLPIYTSEDIGGGYVGFMPEYNGIVFKNFNPYFGTINETIEDNGTLMPNNEINNLLSKLFSITPYFEEDKANKIVVPIDNETYVSKIYIDTSVSKADVMNALKNLTYYRDLDDYYLYDMFIQYSLNFTSLHISRSGIPTQENIATNNFKYKIFISTSLLGSIEIFNSTDGWLINSTSFDINGYCYNANMGKNNDMLFDLIYATTGYYKDGSSNQAFSDLQKTKNEIKDTNYNYISCEPNRVKLDEDYYFISNEEKTNANENIAYWSKEMSNENGTFTSNPTITYLFNSEIDFSEVTLYFQEVCSEFNVYYYLNNTLVEQRNITNNNLLSVSTGDASVSLLEEIKYDKLVIEFVKTQEPYRYIKFNEIDFGTYKTFTSEQIKDISIIEELSIDSSNLSANSLSLSIDDENGEYDILNPNNKLKDLQEKQEITMYHYLQVGSTMQELPLGTFLAKSFSTRNKILQIEAYDEIYFMNKIYYGSKFYNNVSATQIFKDLFNYFNYANYEIEEEISNIKLSGYIPNVEFREAIRLICEASECVVRKSRTGIISIIKIANNYTTINKEFSLRLINNEAPKKNLFNNVVDMTIYDYNTLETNVQIYKGELTVEDKKTQQYTIIYNKYPIDTSEDGSVVAYEYSTDSNGNVVETLATKYTFVAIYGTSCVISLNENVEVGSTISILIRGNHRVETSLVERIQKSNDLSGSEYAISKVNNKLITTSNYKSVGEWKLSREEIRFNFKTPVVPYVEVGDYCSYATRYNVTYNFVPTKIQFSKSIMQSVEGE